jgi:hypothetical protein
MECFATGDGCAAERLRQSGARLPRPALLAVLEVSRPRKKKLSQRAPASQRRYLASVDVLASLTARYQDQVLFTGFPTRVTSDLLINFSTPISWLISEEIRKNLIAAPAVPFVTSPASGQSAELRVGRRVNRFGRLETSMRRPGSSRFGNFPDQRYACR